jgi:hypothetical protein
MRGMAAALVGASVPVAAIAGITARKLSDDTELLKQCLSEWPMTCQRINKLGKELGRLHAGAEQKQPSYPPELFEKIKIVGSYVEDPNSWPNEPQKPWSRERLQWVLDRVDGKPMSPTPEARGHARSLIALLDEHEATSKKIWAAHDRSQKLFDRECNKQWQLFLRIIRTKAETLQGVAEQFRIFEAYWLPNFSASEKVDAALAKLMANTRRLIAAQSKEA